MEAATGGTEGGEGMITKTRGKGEKVNEVPRASTDAYRSGHDRIFGAKPKRATKGKAETSLKPQRTPA